MVLNRLHTKRINGNSIISLQHQGEIVNLTVRALRTYKKRPASYLFRRTGMPRTIAKTPFGPMRSIAAAEPSAPFAVIDPSE